MNTILYATDYSRNSITALKYAHRLSLKLGAKLEVIHVFNYPKVLENEVYEEPMAYEPDAFKRNRKRLIEFCQAHLGDDLENINIDTLENNSVVEGILSKAAELNPVFIVVGAKGISKLKDLIMGNTTKQLIDKAAYTVLSVPAGETIKDIRSIVYATAFENDDVHAICRLIEIAKPLKAAIKTVHISTGKDYQSEMQMEWFKEMISDNLDYDNISFEVVSNDDIFGALISYAKENNADIIAMLERNKGGFLSNLLTRDKIKRMNDYGKYPLMAFGKKKCLTLDLS